MDLLLPDSQSDTEAGFTPQALAKSDLDTPALSIASFRRSDNVDITVTPHSATRALS